MPRKGSTGSTRISQDKKWDVANDLATGYTMHAAARRAGIEPSTVGDWVANDDEFVELVDFIRDEIASSLGDAITAQLSIALNLVNAQALGELPNDDPKVALAERILKATLWRLPYEEQAFAIRLLSGRGRQQLPPGPPGGQPALPPGSR